MRRIRFEQHMAAWERGEMTLPQLKDRHRPDRVEAVLRMHERLERTAASQEASSDWDALRCRLPERPESISDRMLAMLRRPMVAGFAASILGTSVAAASIAPVREGISALWEGAVDVFSGDDPVSPAGASEEGDENAADEPDEAGKQADAEVREGDRGRHEAIPGGPGEPKDAAGKNMDDAGTDGETEVGSKETRERGNPDRDGGGSGSGEDDDSDKPAGDEDDQDAQEADEDGGAEDEDADEDGDDEVEGDDEDSEDGSDDDDSDGAEDERSGSDRDFDQLED